MRGSAPATTSAPIAMDREPCLHHGTGAGADARDDRLSPATGPIWPAGCPRAGALIRRAAARPRPRTFAAVLELVQAGARSNCGRARRFAPIAIRRRDAMTMTDAPENSLFAAPPMAEQERMVEAMLFAAAEPLTLAELAARLPQGCDAGRGAGRLCAGATRGAACDLVQVGDAWAFRTAPDLGFLMQTRNRRDAQAQPRRDRDAGDHRLSPAGHPRRDRGDPRRRGQPRHDRPVAGTGLDPLRPPPDDAGPAGDLRGDRRLSRPFRAGNRARDLPGLKELRAAGLLDNRPRRDHPCRVATVTMRSRAATAARANCSRTERSFSDDLRCRSSTWW